MHLDILVHAINLQKNDIEFLMMFQDKKDVKKFQFKIHELCAKMFSENELSCHLDATNMFYLIFFYLFRIIFFNENKR